MHRDEIKDKVDWTLAYEDDLDWAAPQWEDPLEDRAMAVLQHEAEKNCKTEVLENRKCLERKNAQYFCDTTYEAAMACLDKYMNFQRWEQVRRDMLKSQQEEVTRITGVTKAPPRMPRMAPGAYNHPHVPPDENRARKWWEARYPNTQ